MEDLKAAIRALVDDTDDKLNDEETHYERQYLLEDLMERLMDLVDPKLPESQRGYAYPLAPEYEEIARRANG